MGTAIWKKCPFCGKVYNYDFYNGYPSKENQTIYGSPVKTCKRCNKVFLDNHYREIAIYGVREVDLKKVSPHTIVYSLLGLAVSLGCLFSGISNGEDFHTIVGCVFLVGSAYMFFSELLGYKKRMKWLEQERIESEERLANLSYAILLKNNGYPVPDRFLRKNKK